MKILHTSDWHLGQTLYSYERNAEYIHFFNQLKDILIWNTPDAMLVSGDIFDVSNPPSSVARMFKDTILEFHELMPNMKIIVIAGNHDSASRIDIDRNLWKSGGIHVIGALDRKNGRYNFNDIIIKVGEEGYVAAVPFMNKASLLKGKNGASGEAELFRVLEEEIIRKNPQGLPVVLMAHVAVSNSDTQGHRERPIGGFDSVNTDIFGKSFDYIALGHIHKPQKFEGGKVAYCGAPLAIGFDETFPHSVSLVTVKKGELPDIELLEIKPLRPLKTIPEEGVAFKKALKSIGKLSDDDLSYIRLNVCQKEDLPVDCIEQAVSKTKNKSCRFCTFKYTSTNKSETTPILTGLRSFEFKEMAPGEVAEAYFRSSGLDEEMKLEYLNLIHQLEEELKREEKDNQV